MRSKTLLVAAVLVLVGAPALLAARAATGADAERPRVLVLGDSLAVGLQPYLGELLAERAITWDARSGRTTPEGLQRLRTTLRGVRPNAVVISLGTNDGSDPGRFASRIRRVLRALPPRACVVWPSLVRPPRKGAYHALNRVLRAEARRNPRLVVVDWDVAVRRGEVTLPDALHPDAAGYLRRSSMIADAVRRGC